MKRFFGLPVLMIGLLLATVSSSAFADIISDLAIAKIVEDYHFDDDAGTAYDAAANSANPGNFLIPDSQGDLDDVTTNGSGALNASLKANNELGTTWSDAKNMTSGRVLGVMELTWNFDPDTLNTAENEEIRISLISEGESFVTAEWEIQREDDNTVTILGNGVGTGATDLSPVTLSGGLTQSTKFIAVVDADLDNSTYQIHYSADGGTSFTTMGTANLDPARIVDKMRIVLNNDLSGDSVLIDRAYLAHIPEPASVVLMAWGLAVAAAWCRRRR